MSQSAWWTVSPPGWELFLSSTATFSMNARVARLWPCGHIVSAGAGGLDEGREEAEVRRVLRGPLHADREGLRGVLDDLDQVVLRAPAGRGQPARVGAALVVERVDDHRFAQDRRRAGA